MQPSHPFLQCEADRINNRSILATSTGETNALHVTRPEVFIPPIHIAPRHKFSAHIPVNKPISSKPDESVNPFKEVDKVNATKLAEYARDHSRAPMAIAKGDFVEIGAKRRIKPIPLPLTERIPPVDTAVKLDDNKGKTVVKKPESIKPSVKRPTETKPLPSHKPLQPSGPQRKPRKANAAAEHVIRRSVEKKHKELSQGIETKAKTADWGRILNRLYYHGLFTKLRASDTLTNMAHISTGHKLIDTSKFERLLAQRSPTLEVSQN